MRTRLIVERTFKLAGRPYLLVSGALEGDPLRIGDHITVQTGGEPPIATTVRSIELHSAPGTTTVAVDLGLDAQIKPGTVVVRPE